VDILDVPKDFYQSGSFSCHDVPCSKSAHNCGTVASVTTLALARLTKQKSID
jgi:hypothetical protein